MTKASAIPTLRNKREIIKRGILDWKLRPSVGPEKAATEYDAKMINPMKKVSAALIECKTSEYGFLRIVTSEMMSNPTATATPA